jgi:hypothetical protein
MANILILKVLKKILSLNKIEVNLNKKTMCYPSETTKKWDNNNQKISVT